MIILITGASLTGKTLLAQRMLEEYRIPYVSIDHLKMGLIRCGMTDLTPEDDEALTDYLWPIVREIIKTAIENLMWRKSNPLTLLVGMQTGTATMQNSVGFL